MEADPNGEEGQHEQRCNKDQKSKAFQAKQDEVCRTEFKRSCDAGVPPVYFADGPEGCVENGAGGCVARTGYVSSAPSALVRS